jgi:predicted nucleic acid-binding protein
LVAPEANQIDILVQVAQAVEVTQVVVVQVLLETVAAAVAQVE